MTSGNWSNYLTRRFSSRIPAALILRQIFAGLVAHWRKQFFKLLRPSAGDAEELSVDLGGIAIWEYVSRIQVDEIRLGFFAHVETLVEFALLRPGALPEINRRIDALDNATLQEHLRALRSSLLRKK